LHHQRHITPLILVYENILYESLAHLYESLHLLYSPEAISAPHSFLDVVL